MRIGDLLDYPRLANVLDRPLQFIRARRTGEDGGLYDIALKDGRTLRLRGGTGDFHVFHRVFIADEYRLSDLSLPKHSWVIDVGAHIGIFSLKVASGEVRIVSVEPATENLIFLHHNLRSNRLEDKVRVCNQALHSTVGHFELSKLIDPYDYSLSRAPGSLEPETVRTTTLQNLMAEHGIETCELLKLDCEGSEYEILLNTPPDVLQSCRRIRMEFHCDAGFGQDSSHLKEHMKSLGFRTEFFKMKKHRRQGYLFCVRR